MSIGVLSTRGNSNYILDKMIDGDSPFYDPEEEDNTMSMTDVSTIMTSPPRELIDPSGGKRQRSQGSSIPFPALHTGSGGSQPTLVPALKGGDRNNSVSQLYLQQAPAASDNSKRLISKLKDLYKYKVLPIEKKNFLHHFCLPTSGPIEEAEFDARPMVLLVGPYSTGKTTFIRHLIGGDFPGCSIGPEPTTDKFIALVHGDEDGVSYDDDDGDENKDYFGTKEKSPKHIQGKIVKGNTLTVTPELPFSSLSSFGSAFLNHFNGSVCSAPLLRNITLVDTPGVLSGEKQRNSRDYEFSAAAKWFADRSDLILLLVDAHKLDFSDELKDLVETIRPHNDDKIRCVLNKADGLDRNQLVRVYGSLMWSLGKLFHSPEVVKVYAGSFWEKPLDHDDFQTMFDADEWLLMNELMHLPIVAAERKVNAMVQRIRLIKVHVCILGFLRSQVPQWYGKAAIRKRQIETLDEVFEQVRTLHSLPVGDMPNVDRFRECLLHFDDFEVFPLLDRNALRQLDDLITKDIPAIMKGSSGVSDAKSMSRGKRRVFKAKSHVVKEETGSYVSPESTSTPAKAKEVGISAASRRGNLIVNAILGLTIAVLAAAGGYVVHLKLLVPPAESDTFNLNLAPIAGLGEIDPEEL